MLDTLLSWFSQSTSKQAEDTYPYPRIWINGRHVTIEKIVQSAETPRSPFESSTFQFIKDWFSREETFAMTTSGSTGPPKAIHIHRSQMINSALLTAQMIDLRKNSTALLCIDPQYIGGKMMLVRSFVLGLPLKAVDPVSNPLVKIPIDKCVQFTAFVPYQIQSILESKHPHLLNNLDKVLIGGASLNEAMREKLSAYQCECYETYGMTETVSHVALRLTNTDRKQPYFTALPGVRFGKDHRGCLIVNADYLNGTFITNDLVDLIESDKFMWRGRWDNVINTGGVKVIPEKVEQQLEAIFFKNNFHHRFFIAALPDDKLGNKVILVLEGAEVPSDILASSLAELRTRLSHYELPRETHTIPQFISTASQKVDRNRTIAAISLRAPLR